MSCLHFNQATFLAARAADAQDIGPVTPPTQLALPGAKTALTLERVQAHQQLGRDTHEIVKRENAAWHERHRDRLAEHAQWVNGPYAHAIQRLREQHTRQRAEELQRRARFERWMTEHQAAE